MIEMVMSTEGQALVSTYKFVAVPAIVMNKNTAGIARIVTSASSSCSNEADTLQGTFPFDDTSEAQSLKIYGSGTTNPKKVHWHLMHLFAERMKIHKNKRIRLTYNAIGSGPGRDEFAAAATYPYASSSNKGVAGEKIYRPRPAKPVAANYAGTPDKGGYQKIWKSEMGCAELPLSSEQVTKIEAAGRKALHLPMVLGAISFFVNLPGYSGQIKLSPDVLANIFTGKITTWDHSDIASINGGSGFNPPAGQKITVVHRIKGSSSTYLSTEYLAKTSAAGIWDITEADCQEPWFSSTCPADSTAKYAEIMGWDDEAQNSPQWPSCSANAADSTGNCGNTFMFGARGSGKVRRRS
jgi:ABC-type phosphate transport system substrate-binding protein